MVENDYRTFRREWSERLKKLRAILGKPDQHQQAIDLFMQQHAVLHTAQISQPETWSYADEVMNGLSETQIRQIPEGDEHSVAWLLWHLARIEDVALNVLVAGSPQVWNAGDWEGQLRAPIHNTGNAMTAEEVSQLSTAISIKALLNYRLAVGRRTREIVQRLQPEELKQKVDPARIKQILDDGAVVEAASSITDYWSRRTVAGLLLMPATRHNLVHLNEIEKLKKKL